MCIFFSSMLSKQSTKQSLASLIRLFKLSMPFGILIHSFFLLVFNLLLPVQSKHCSAPLSPLLPLSFVRLEKVSLYSHSFHGKQSQELGKDVRRQQGKLGNLAALLLSLDNVMTSWLHATQGETKSLHLYLTNSYTFLLPH